MQKWRREESVVRVKRPTRIDRARTLGYKAKQASSSSAPRYAGAVAEVQVRQGRRTARMGMARVTAAKSIQRIAEERAGRKYPNMEVLNSYWVGEDGVRKFYEVILVDRDHPGIRNDPTLNWICDEKNRAFRGKTSAGKKGRGMRHRGRGTEKTRPSIRSHKNQGK